MNKAQQELADEMVDALMDVLYRRGIEFERGTLYQLIPDATVLLPDDDEGGDGVGNTGSKRGLSEV